jgi:hypothetical protein
MMIVKSDFIFKGTHAAHPPHVRPGPDLDAK